MCNLDKYQIVLRTLLLAKKDEHINYIAILTNEKIIILKLTNCAIWIRL